MPLKSDPTGPLAIFRAGLRSHAVRYFLNRRCPRLFWEGLGGWSKGYGLEKHARKREDRTWSWLFLSLSISLNVGRYMTRSSSNTPTSGCGRWISLVVEAMRVSFLYYFSYLHSTVIFLFLVSICIYFHNLSFMRAIAVDSMFLFGLCVLD